MITTIIAMIEIITKKIKEIREREIHTRIYTGSASRGHPRLRRVPLVMAYIQFLRNMLRISLLYHKTDSPNHDTTRAPLNQVVRDLAFAHGNVPNTKGEFPPLITRDTP